MFLLVQRHGFVEVGQWTDAQRQFYVEMLAKEAEIAESLSKRGGG